MVLFAERICLRAFSKKDFKAVHEYSSDPDTVKYMTFGPNTERETRQFINRTIEANTSLPRYQYAFVVEKLDDKKVIGACSLYLRSKNEGEIGWVLNRDYWNNGYTTEAALTLLAFAFEELKLHRVISRCISDNTGSWHVMEKCNMRREACFKKVRKLLSDPDGPWHDEYLYAILREEWEKED